MFSSMFKKLFIGFLIFTTTLSQTCYTPYDIIQKNLVSYQNKVYDISKYNHPGGKELLLLSVGKPLEEYFNTDRYYFHITSSQVRRDLENLYVGNLQNNCTIPNNTITKNQYATLLEDNNIFYLTITFSIFGILLICVIISKYFNCKILNENIKIPYFGYYSKDVILFYFIYILWWVSLLILSFIPNVDILEKLGIWICLNIAFTLLPVTRNSVWVSSLKLSYSKLMVIHRLISVLCLLSVLTKIITIVVLYNYTYLYKDTSSIFGIACSLSIFLICIFSMPIIRKSFFELFYYSHRILCLLTIISMAFHYIICLYYILPSFGLYILDILIRLLKTKKAIYSKVKVFNFSKEYNTTYIIIYITLLKPVNIKPGCYFFICSDKISKLEWHPLSLIYEKNDNLVFCAKNNSENSWSYNLKNLKNTDNIYLQGPYYHLNLKYNYEYIINIANGIGVTPFFTILKNLNDIIQEEKTIIKKVVFVWIVPDIEFLKPFVEYFNDLENIDIQIFLTKKNITELEFIKFGQIFFDRPIINDYVKNFMEVNKIKDTKKVSIISCGSKKLLNDIYVTTTSYGIDLYNESFI